MTVQASAGARPRSPWANFHRLHEELYLHTVACRKADAEVLAVEHAVRAEEEGAANRLAVAKKEHAYAHAGRRLAEAFFLAVDN